MTKRPWSVQAPCSYMFASKCFCSNHIQQFICPLVKQCRSFQRGLVHCKLFHTQEKQSDQQIRIWKSVGDSIRETGWWWRYKIRRGDGRMWEKLRKTEEERLRVIPNDHCHFYCTLALRHGGGSDRHNLFSCKSPFRGSPSNSFSITSLSSTAVPPALRLPLIPPHPLLF